MAARIDGRDLTGIPCGCLLVATCVHRDPDAPRLTEPPDAGPVCTGDGFDCCRFTIQQLAALGRRGLCCRDVELREAS